MEKFSLNNSPILLSSPTLQKLISIYRNTSSWIPTHVVPETTPVEVIVNKKENISPTIIRVAITVRGKIVCFIITPT